MTEELRYAPSLLQQVRAHAKARDSIAWSGQARQLLLWAADTIEAANAALRSETAATRWLAFDIGCIECGEDSAVIGTYATKEEAEAACKVASDEQQKHWRGQHSMEVFELPKSAEPPKSGAHLVSKQALQEMLSRAEMAAEVTLPIEQFRDLVLQAMEAT